MVGRQISARQISNSGRILEIHLTHLFNITYYQCLSIQLASTGQECIRPSVLLVVHYDQHNTYLLFVTNHQQSFRLLLLLCRQLVSILILHFGLLPRPSSAIFVVDMLACLHLSPDDDDDPVLRGSCATILWSIEIISFIIKWVGRFSECHQHVVQKRVVFNVTKVCNTNCCCASFVSSCLSVIWM